ncbi:MAG TPA: YdcF family protein [Stellaceae bacterium]
MTGRAAAPPAKRPRRGLRWLGIPAAILTLLFLLWLGGLAWFAQSIPDEVSDPTSATDAIVVLTGGSLRVQSGIALLNAGKAKKLFVSGVNHGTDMPALLRAEHQSSDKVPCCIALGYDADNTFGNAQETAVWMRREGFHSLRLVTASYHMPRSLLEFSRAMPDVRIIPHPVFPERVKQERWWAWPGTASLIVAEYQKYLLAWARPMLGQSAGGSKSS